MSLYLVKDEDNLYGERVGEVIWEDDARVMLDLGNDRVLFTWSEVERVI